MRCLRTLGHLPWAWGHFVLPDGYIPATAQRSIACPLLTASRLNPPTPLHLVLRTPCRDHACKPPWLVLTLSLPRMSCCNLVASSAARRPFAKHSSAGPSLLLFTLSATLRAPIPPARRWRPQPSPALGKYGCFCPAQSPKVPKHQLLARFAAFCQGDWGSLLRAAIDEAGAVGLHSASPSDDCIGVLRALPTLHVWGNRPQQGKPSLPNPWPLSLPCVS